MSNDRLDQLADIWHIDGPYSADAALDAGSAISELVRYLNHSTLHGGRFEYVSELGRLTDNLRRAAYGLDQVLTQLRAEAVRMVNTDDLYDDAQPDSPDAGTRKARQSLEQFDDARISAMTFARALEALSSTLNGIGHRRG